MTVDSRDILVFLLKIHTLSQHFQETVRKSSASTRSYVTDLFPVEAQSNLKGRVFDCALYMIFNNI